MALVGMGPLSQVKSVLCEKMKAPKREKNPLLNELKIFFKTILPRVDGANNPCRGVPGTLKQVYANRVYRTRLPLSLGVLCFGCLVVVRRLSRLCFFTRRKFKAILQKTSLVSLAEAIYTRKIVTMLQGRYFNEDI